MPCILPWGNLFLALILIILLLCFCSWVAAKLSSLVPKAKLIWHVTFYSLVLLSGFQFFPRKWRCSLKKKKNLLWSYSFILCYKSGWLSRDNPSCEHIEQCCMFIAMSNKGASEQKDPCPRLLNSGYTHSPSNLLCEPALNRGVQF